MNTAQAGIEQRAPHWSTRRISVLLTIVALVLWAYSIARAKFEIGSYGLISGFPAYYFLALGILTIASAILWVSKEDHWRLLGLQLGFLVVAIWLAPQVVGGSPPMLDNMGADLGSIEYITRLGHFRQTVVWTHNWPIAWIFWAMGIRVAGVSMDGFANFMLWLPFIWQLVMFLPVFMFFRNTIGKASPNYCWAAMWVFYLGEWFETQNTGAQAFGVLSVFSILALLTMTPAWRQRAGTFGHRASAIILLGASVVTHLFGSMVSLGITATLQVSKRVRFSNLAIVAGVVLVAWSLYCAVGYFESRLPAFLEQGLRLDVATEKGVLSPLSGSKAHSAVASVRIIFSGLLLAIAIVGALLTWKVRAWKVRGITYNDVTVLACGAGCVVAAAIVGAGYGHELYQRLLVYLLPVVAYFGVKWLRFRAPAVILCLLLLIALPLVFVARYGNQSIDYLSPGYVAGATVFQDSTTSGYVVAEMPFGRMEHREQYLIGGTSHEDLKWQDNELAIFGSRVDLIPRYICISNHDSAKYAFFYSEPQLVNDVASSLNASTNVDLVYANPDLSLYVCEIEK